MFRTIVVPLDRSDAAEAAVPHGAAIARQSGARLRLMMVRPAYVDAATVHDRLREVAARHHVDAELFVAGPEDVAATLVDVASEPQTLLCLRTHARGPVAELVIGSVSEQVVRASHRPVLLIGPRCGAAAGRIGSMVVGLDGSELAEQILPTVGSWATQLGLTPWLIQVMSPPRALEVGNGRVLDAGYVHYLAAQLRRQGVEAGWDTLHDRDVAKAIVRCAEEHDPAMIALTTHGHSGLGRVVLGGVALQVAHLASCPVLVMRPAGARAATARPGGQPSSARRQG
jgi:nucleotide-binding universal stress UspA family protein